MLVVVAERADQALCVAAHLLQRADRVALGLAEDSFVRRGEGNALNRTRIRKSQQSHAALSFLIGRTLSAATISEISLVMKRAVIGVPS